MAAISVKATVLYTCLFIIVRGCSAETCKINLMVQCMGCLLCSVAEILLLESFSTDDEHDYEYEFDSFSQLYS